MTDDGNARQGGSEYGDQPPYGDPQAPPYAPPPPYPQPPPYAQPPYMAGPYAPPQYPQWGQSDLAAQYAAEGTPMFPGSPAEAAGDGGRRAGIWVAVIFVVLAALAVGGYFVFRSDNGEASSPRLAVSKLLDAAKTGDTEAAKKVLCKRDDGPGALLELQAGGDINSYTVNAVTPVDGSHAVVHVTLSTSLVPTPAKVAFPAVKESGIWKACPRFGNVRGSGGAIPPPGGTPTFPSVSVTPPAPGGGDVNPCSFATTPEQAATIYVGVAETGETDVAQACVFHDSVPESVTASLETTGTGFFAPTGSHGSTFLFVSVDGQNHLAVTVTKERDGRLYVTNVEKS